LKEWSGKNLRPRGARLDDGGRKARSHPLLVGSTSPGNEQKTSSWSLARAILPISLLAMEQVVDVVDLAFQFASSCAQRRLRRVNRLATRRGVRNYEL